MTRTFNRGLGGPRERTPSFGSGGSHSAVATLPGGMGVLPFLVPELPAMMVLPYVLFDLIKGGYVASSLFNDSQLSYQAMARRPDD